MSIKWDYALAINAIAPKDNAIKHIFSRKHFALLRYFFDVGIWMNSQSISSGSGASSTNSLFIPHIRSLSLAFAFLPLFSQTVNYSQVLVDMFSRRQSFFICSVMKETNAVPANFVLSSGMNFSKWWISCSIKWILASNSADISFIFSSNLFPMKLSATSLTPFK